MFQDNNLKKIFIQFCEEQIKIYNIDEAYHLNLYINVFSIYYKLICDKDYVYLSIIESMLSFELSNYVLFSDYSLYQEYREYFWSYSVEQGIITQKDISDCLSLGLSFYCQEDEYHTPTHDYDEYYDNDYDDIFQNNGSKQKQYYLIRKSK